MMRDLLLKSAGKWYNEDSAEMRGTAMLGGIRPRGESLKGDPHSG
jgi:hypothetical protein